jgi:hypothetical protein
MKKLLVFLLSMAAVSAQTNEDKGKRIVMDALAALGGDRFLAMRDRTETGRAYSFYNEELSGLSVATIQTKYQTVSGPPSIDSLGVLERQAFGKKQEEGSVLFTNTAAYDITFRGARPIQDEPFQRYKETVWRNIFYVLRMRLTEPGLLFDSKGLEVWMNQPVQIVDITDAQNQVLTVYFNESSKLPVYQVFYRRDPKTRERIEEVTEYGKYRQAAGGVSWPLTTQRTRDKQKIYELYSDTVTINDYPPDSLFELPAGVKMLPKER